MTLHNGRTGAQLHAVELGEYGDETVRCSPDGRLLATAGKGEISLSNASTGVVGHKWEVPSVQNLEFSPDGKYLASGNLNGTVYLFDVPGRLRNSHSTAVGGHTNKSARPEPAVPVPLCKGTTHAFGIAAGWVMISAT